MNVKDADRDPAAHCWKSLRAPGPQGTDPPLLPLLLAHRHTPHLQGHPHLVRRVEAPREMVELNRADPLGSRVRRLRRFGNWLEAGAGLGDQPQPVLGLLHPGVGVPERPPVLHRFDRPSSKRCPGCASPTSTSTIVDPVTFPCPSAGDHATRVPEVLDCWFESGAMPYAQVHYPFEHPEGSPPLPRRLHRRGPRPDPGLVLHPAWSWPPPALRRKPFRNCVVNGMILAEDGRKMSKSLKNYPDPREIIERPTGGCPARLPHQLTGGAGRTTPVLRGRGPRCGADGAAATVERLFVLHHLRRRRRHRARRPRRRPTCRVTARRSTDGSCRSSRRSSPTVNREMEGYYLYNVIPRRSDSSTTSPTGTSVAPDAASGAPARVKRRPRDKLAAFATLHEVLVTFSKVLAPVLPSSPSTSTRGWSPVSRPRWPPSATSCSWATRCASRAR
jgi:hypothetical protein